MTTVIKNTKKIFEKKHVKDIKVFLTNEKTKDEKRPETDMKIFLKKKKKNSVSIIMNVIESF